MNGLLSKADRTRTELLANRRRFQREGVTLVAGDRDQLFALPIVSTKPIAVRPAVRLCDDLPSALEQGFNAFFERTGPFLIGVLLTLLVALVVVQVFVVPGHPRG